MKNNTLIFLALSTMSLNSAFATDKFDYIPTPEHIQVADLHDVDNDGVINARDLCANTPVGAEVDNDGCETYLNKEEQYQLKILFANDSDSINPVFQRKITELTAFLKKYPTTSIEIQGYASKVGTAAYNLELSRRRASNVRNLLIKQGISEERLTIVGFGDTHLAKLGTDDVSHALNRRVTATVIGHKGMVKDEWTIFTTFPKVD
ncbi:OmpA family protein [Vibrio rotiferianus]|uniref:OmpA family protein n=1 Tax=Vibrio rotiferianus TaxID=190895 RepID=UPI0028957196|nr:OmpA-like domain-containing protein [Vibrio rotiferianus]CAH1560418.1 OmpA-like domain-containing protein [Vibrio rotiferianus]